MGGLSTPLDAAEAGTKVTGEWATRLDLAAMEAATVRATPLFQGLSDDSLDLLLAGSTVQALAEGTALFVQDEPAERFFLLLDGWMKLYRLSAEGAEAIVGVIAPGETFAEAASFASAVYPVCADAIARSRVLALTVVSFKSAIAVDGGIALRMLGSLSRRQRHLVEQIEHLQVKSAPQRLASFLVSLCPASPGSVVLALPLPKAFIAQRLGMRPETFSRAMRALLPVGVAHEGPRVKIADVGTLARFAGADRVQGCG
jgi:CRP-like cAMP-binding protein